MWSDATAVTGVADHDVVKARVRHKAKLLSQCLHAHIEQVHALDQ
jgi:hypothetical protein